MISCGRTTDLSQTRLTGFCAPASPPPLGSATGPDSPRAKGAKSAGPESEQPVLALLRFGCAAVGTWLPRSGPQTVLVSGRDGIGQSPRLMGAGPKPLCFSGFGHCVPESGALAQPGPRRARPTPLSLGLRGSLLLSAPRFILRLRQLVFSLHGPAFSASVASGGRRLSSSQSYGPSSGAQLSLSKPRFQIPRERNPTEQLGWDINLGLTGWVLQLKEVGAQAGGTPPTPALQRLCTQGGTAPLAEEAGLSKIPSPGGDIETPGKAQAQRTSVRHP